MIRLAADKATVASSLTDWHHVNTQSWSDEVFAFSSDLCVPSSFLIRVWCVRRTQREEDCGGLPLWVRSWPFTSSSCRDRQSRSSATYTHSESMLCDGFGTRELLYTVQYMRGSTEPSFVCSLRRGYVQCLTNQFNWPDSFFFFFTKVAPSPLN